jgi:hypothetical protein
VEPAQNTDHELIYQRAAVSQPSMQNDVSMAPISTRAQSTGGPRSQSNGTLQQGSRSIWILGSSIVYCTGQEVASRQGGRHLGLHNVGFQGFWFGKRGMAWKELIPKIEFLFEKTSSSEICCYIAWVKRSWHR